MAKPRVNIGCPQHGGLNPPYKTTLVDGLGGLIVISAV